MRLLLSSRSGTLPSMNTPASAVNRPESRLAMLQTLGAFVTGVLVVLAFPLYGRRFGLDLLIWVALVPLMAAATGRGARRGVFLGMVAGATLEGAGFVWIYLSIIRFTDMPAILSALAFTGQLLYAVIPWAVLGWALGRCRREADLLWAGVLWIAVEHGFPRLFPWHIGGALYGRRELVQCVDLFGASGLSALVFLVNVVVFRVCRSRRGSIGGAQAANAGAQPARLPWRAGGAAIALLAAALVYGHFRLGKLEALREHASTLEVGMVQGAKTPISPALSEAEYYQAAARQLEYYVAESTALLRSGQADGKALELLVWPEGVDEFPLELGVPDPWRLHAEVRPEVLRFLKSPPVSLVFGTNGVRRGRKPLSSNVAAYVGRRGIRAVYEKMELMPFGERVPLLDLVPPDVREMLGLRVGNMFAGTENPAVKVNGRRFRLLICYEAILPAFVRQHASGIEFFVNITEDVWYGRTAHTSQHVSMLILRAIENRIPVVRCTNMGPSGVIDATGAFHRDEAVFAPASMRRTLVPGRAGSLYRSGGFAFPWVALGIVLARWSWSRWGRRSPDGRLRR